MIQLKRILLPTDFSEYSAAARQYACAFADQFRAELHVLHVIQDLAPLVPEPGVMLPPPADYLKELETERETDARAGVSSLLGPPAKRSFARCGKVRHFWRSSVTRKRRTSI